ncbi:GYF domain-containing protein [Stenotrophomonas forensis]
MQEAQWWYANSRQSEGPVDLAGLRRLWQEGTVTARTLMWCEGMPSWRPLSELEQAAAPVEAAPAAEFDAAVASGGSAPSVGDPSDPYRAPAAVTDTAVTAGLEGEMALYAAVVGGNFPIYRQRWRLDQGIATGSGTWHWPAFLLGLVWMMYRRMYRLAAMWAGLLLLISVIETLLDVPDGLSLIITVALSITTGAFGNTWYLAHCQRLIARARAESRGDETRLHSELSARGGTSVVATVIALVIAAVLSTVGAGLAG